MQASLRDLLRHQPDSTLRELQQRLGVRVQVRVSVQHLWRVLQRMGWRLKTKSPHAQGQDAVEVQTRHQAWWATVSRLDLATGWCS